MTAKLKQAVDSLKALKESMGFESLDELAAWLGSVEECDRCGAVAYAERLEPVEEVESGRIELLCPDCYSVHHEARYANDAE